VVIRSALAHGVKAASAAIDVVHRPPRGLVALIYHRVGDASGQELELPLDVFDAQMAELAASGRATTLGDALARLAGPEPAGPAADPIVVTFDDGTVDFAEQAVPVLERHGIPALLYVATDFVERAVDFPHDGRPISWAALRDARSTGLVEVGSHTHSHLLLDRVDPAAAADDLDRSIDLIRERLGATAEHFAYPKAVGASPAVEPLVRQRFRSAALAGTRPNRYGCTDPYRVARSPIQRRDGMVWFRRKLAGGLGLEDALRETANRRRYAGRTT
jgi:peptidoglycan/xylan/chitin deacetylase (PgdA/CDA1 family)